MAQPWLSVDGWRAGQSAGWTLDGLAGEACVVGIDLASKLDLCAMTALFPPTAQRATWRVVRWVWTRADRLEAPIAIALPIFCGETRGI